MRTALDLAIILLVGGGALVSLFATLYRGSIRARRRSIARICEVLAAAPEDGLQIYKIQTESGLGGVDVLNTLSDLVTRGVVLMRTQWRDGRVVSRRYVLAKRERGARRARFAARLRETSNAE
jgi:hypothetical protein